MFRPARQSHHAGRDSRQRLLKHGFAHPVEHEPSALVRDLKLAGNLKRRDALLVGAHYVDGINPLADRDVRPLKDRTAGDAELLATSATLPLLADGRLHLASARVAMGVGNLIDLLAAVADRAGDIAVRPAQIGERLLRSGFVSEEASDVCDAVEFHASLYGTEGWSKQVLYRPIDAKVKGFPATLVRSRDVTGKTMSKISWIEDEKANQQHHR